MESKSNFGKSRNPARKQGKRSARRAPTHSNGMAAVQALKLATPIFDAQKRLKLRYYDKAGSLTTTSVATNYFYSANGAYDPDVSGTGHQPMGFDQMMLMYEQYTVVASKISVTMANGTSAVIRGGIYLSPDTTSITDPLRLMENGLIDTKFHSALGVAGYIQSHNLNCDVPSYFGRNRNARELVQDVTLSGSSAANPTEQVYFAVTAWDPLSASVWSCYYDVVIEYDIIFWEPRKLTVS